MSYHTVSISIHVGQRLEEGRSKKRGQDTQRQNQNSHKCIYAPGSFIVDGEKYEVVDVEDYTKYLGRRISCNDPHETEFDNRVAKAWAAFSKYKRELTDRRYRLQSRLRLFESVVTATLLYGCESWILRADQRKKLGVLQRKMLRMLLNAKRRNVHTSSSSSDASVDTTSEAPILEPWVVFLRRTARLTESQL